MQKKPWGTSKKTKQKEEKRERGATGVFAESGGAIYFKSEGGNGPGVGAEMETRGGMQRKKSTGVVGTDRGKPAKALGHPLGCDGQVAGSRPGSRGGPTKPSGGALGRPGDTEVRQWLKGRRPPGGRKVSY